MSTNKLIESIMQDASEEALTKALENANEKAIEEDK